MAEQTSQSLSYPSTKRTQWQNLGAASLGYLTDGLDQMIISFTLTAVIASFALNSVQAGAIATATMVGTWVGSYAFGLLADYVGRVRTLSWTILLYAASTGLSALSPNYHMLLFWRFLVGLGIGGEFGIGMTLVTESWPAKIRAQAGSYVAIGFSLGVLLASFVTLLILPHWGWRGVMVVGVLPAILAAWARFRLKEPADFQTARTHRRAFPLTDLFASGKITKVTLALLFMTTVQNFGYYAIMLWMPSTLEKVHHYTLGHTTEWTLITTTGMIVGIIFFGWLCDTIGRKPSYIILFLGTALMIPLYFSITSPVIVLWGGFILGAFVNGGMGGYGALLSEHYPTESRSTAENFIFGTGRGVGGGLGPLLIGLLATQMSITSALTLLFIVYPVAALFVWRWVPERKGQELPA
ncbi:MAG: MFS transporter [Sulfobacillus thermosulfidooxidans]|uniref:MFS transporter n=1 Tax=Sulfobacillus TaxID=28033 RepID=UPI000CD18093|nr:MFS transporter [Sulfobacillus sp. hq2]POB10077.1 MFS transporter [Sulfobacillus sp. hq2]PSR37721.1 MAG: MFS transporter [Sulfobacillus thermosulfidooxidans]